MLQRLAIFFFLLTFVVLSYAEDSADQPDGLQGELTLPPLTAPRFEMTPQISVVAISALSLPTPGYTVNYVPTIEGLPTFQLLLGRSVADVGRVNLTVQASIAYGSRSGAFQTSPEGSRVQSSENLTLRWIPMVLSTRFAYRSVNFPYLRPSLTLGFGSLALIQNADNPALNKTMGIPLMVVSPALTFMDGGSRHWLGGFTFGATILRGLGGDSKVAATSLDLSINLLL